MARVATKLKEEPTAPPPPQRQGLVDAIALVTELLRALAANEEEQLAARQKIRELERTLQDGEEKLKTVPPLERRGLRVALSDAKETLEDWQDHLAALQKVSGNFQGSHLDKQGTLASKLEFARASIDTKRGELLRRHPYVLAMFARLHSHGVWPLSPRVAALVLLAGGRAAGLLWVLDS
jgi:hypothetical protein